MAFRLQKRIKIAPGVKINLSKRGISTSVGVRGASLNVGKKGIRSTAGIPGTGLSWSKANSWSGSAGVSSADELVAFITEITKLADKFNKVSPAMNGSIEAWNEALGNYSSGRGPSPSKLETLSKRHIATTEKLDARYDEVEDFRAYLNAICERVESFRFGTFQREAKKQRAALVNDIDNFRSGIDAVQSRIRDMQAEIEQELSSIGT